MLVNSYEDRIREMKEISNLNKQKLKNNLYFVIIGMASLVVLVFVPMIGSQVGVDFNLPTTPAGWAIWATTKIIVAVLNMIIFFSFVRQGKLNVKADSRYLEAIKMLNEMVDSTEVRYLSPKKHLAKVYGGKGTTLFLSTALSLVALTNAFLTYDYMSLLSYAIVIIMGVIFGLVQMVEEEDYWTVEFPGYVRKIKEDLNNGSNH